MTNEDFQYEVAIVNSNGTIYPGQALFQHRSDAAAFGDEICPSCIEQALLADETWVDWPTVGERLTEEGR